MSGREPGVPHSGIEDLALLAEGRLGPAETAALQAHLARCRSCAAAYAEAVRYRAAWLTTEEAFAPPRELVDAGLAARAGSSGTAAPARAGRPRGGARTQWKVAMALVACLAAIAIPALFRSLQIGAGDLPTAIREALEASSAHGLVLPGGERGAAAEPPVLRGGDSAPLSDAVGRAVQAYERGRRTSARAYAAGAGLLVAGQIATARDYAEEGLRSHPRDVRLLVLAADLAYRRSDMAEAERCLRQALESRPGDAVATLDLGIVLAESGRRAEAARLFEAVAERQPGSHLAERARRELGNAGAGPRDP